MENLTRNKNKIELVGTGNKYFESAIGTRMNHEPLTTRWSLATFQVFKPKNTDTYNLYGVSIGKPPKPKQFRNRITNAVLIFAKYRNVRISRMTDRKWLGCPVVFP